MCAWPAHESRSSASGLVVTGEYLSVILTQTLVIARSHHESHSQQTSEDWMTEWPLLIRRWSAVVSFVSLVWLTFAAVIFTFPQKFPIRGENFNFASVAVGGVVVVVTLAWVLSARFWFTGPRIDVDNSDAVKTKYWITDPPRKDLQVACVRSSLQ